MDKWLVVDYWLPIRQPHNTKDMTGMESSHSDCYVVFIQGNYSNCFELNATRLQGPILLI